MKIGTVVRVSGYGGIFKYEEDHNKKMVKVKTYNGTSNKGIFRHNVERLKMRPFWLQEGDKIYLSNAKLVTIYTFGLDKNNNIEVYFTQERVLGTKILLEQDFQKYFYKFID